MAFITFVLKHFWFFDAIVDSAFLKKKKKVFHLHVAITNNYRFF